MYIYIYICVYIYTFATIAATATIAAIAAIAAIATMRLLQLLQLLQLFAPIAFGPRASWAGFAYAGAHFAYAEPTRKLPTNCPPEAPWA